MVLAAVLVLSACAHLPPVPLAFDPEAYRPATYQELQQPVSAGLQPGDKIKVSAYFWQFLTYDPAILANYPNYLRYPLSWPRLEWAALYGSPDMRDYFDLVVMTTDQRERYRLKRLDHIRLYGELAALSPGKLYLRVHHLDIIDND